MQKQRAVLTLAFDGRVMERDGGDRDALGDLFGDAFGDSTDNEDGFSNDDGGEEAETTGTNTKRDANVRAVN
ncbi:hypothetical protein PINS_up011806 [Pythium insidiosum]|nr:hypothetical protein PINS_up011806 [Pythium insidiosum]